MFWGQIMALAKAGVSRQESHEQIRVLSHQASQVVKKEGKNNDLIERVKKTHFFKPIWDQLDNLMDPKTFIGRAPQLTELFLRTEVAAALERYSDLIKAGWSGKLHV